MARALTRQSKRPGRYRRRRRQAFTSVQLQEALVTPTILEMWLPEGCDPSTVAAVGEVLKAASAPRGEDDADGPLVGELDDNVVTACVQLLTKGSAALGVRIASMRALALSAEGGGNDVSDSEGSDTETAKGPTTTTMGTTGPTRQRSPAIPTH